MKIGHLASLFFIFMASLNAEPSSVQENSNGLPNPSARFNPNSRGFDVFAGLIVWTAREVSADCWAEVITTDNSSTSNDLQQIHFGWDPGFRVGMG